MLAKLASILEYAEAFSKAFGKEDAFANDNLALALAAFERTLSMQDRFDDFQNGKADALNKQEKKWAAPFYRNRLL